MIKWLKMLLVYWLARCLNAASYLANFGGKFQMEHYRDGKLMGKYPCPNGIVDVGMNLLLNVMFHNTPSPSATWYLGLVNNSGFSAFANADTMASHSGWTEFTAYDEANRVAWAEDAAASRSISNTTSSDFTINATGTLKGIFVVDQNTKGGTTGTLWSTAAFATLVNVVDNDVIKITYTITG